MKRTILSSLIGALFRPGVANTTSFTTTSFGRIPSGLVADPTAELGLLAFQNNSNLIDSAPLVAVPIAAATTFTLTAAQFLAQIVDVSGSPGSGVTLTTPTAAQIIAALPTTVPKDGFNFLWYLMNDATGQNITLAGGTGVTLNQKTTTTATDTTRMFLVNININAGTVTMVNIGGGLTL